MSPLFSLVNTLSVNLQVMIVVGGQAPKAIRSVECYDFQEDRWYQVADLPSRRCRAGQFVQSVRECMVGPDAATHVKFDFAVCWYDNRNILEYSDTEFPCNSLTIV